jgi:hypothetical protein
MFVRGMILFFLVSNLVYPIIGQNQSQAKEEQKSLIMKDLLKPNKKPLPPPKRNIFTRQRGSSVAEEFSPQENFSSQGLTTAQKKSPDQKEAAAVETGVNVQYIGYVQSGQRVVALIILGGQTYAVESGDVLESGVTIGEITPADLEITGQGSQPKRIKLEGE